MFLTYSAIVLITLSFGLVVKAIYSCVDSSSVITYNDCSSLLKT